MYDAASSILQQKLSQIVGVGQVNVGGSALPAVRVEINPTQLSHLGISLEDVRTALSNANTNRPKGELSDEHNSWALSTTDQLLKADQYQPLIIKYANGAPVQLSDVALVRDSVENVRTAGMVDGKNAVLIIIFRQPGANIIDTVDRVRAALPQLGASISPAINLKVVMDRTTTIRASVRDVELSLIISISLVIMVVFLFLRNARMYSRRFASGSEANWELLVSFATATLSLVGGRCRGHIFHATTPATAISTPATIPIGKRRELPDCIAAALPLGLN